MRNCVIIASNAGFLARVIQDALAGGMYNTVIAANKNELTEKMSVTYPRYIFMENCFLSNGTEEYIMKILRGRREVKMVVWTAMELNPVLAARFIMAGAESFFSLRDTEKHIQEIVNHILLGETYCPEEVTELINRETFDQKFGGKVTSREIQIIKLSSKGRGNKEIAHILGVSLATVKFHKVNVYRKCGGNTPVDILRYGLLEGVICPEDLGNPGNGGKDYDSTD